MSALGYIPAGLKNIGVGTVDADGIFIGGDATAPAAGDQAGSPLRRLYGAKTVPLQPAEDEIVTATGDDKPLAQFNFGAADFPQGQIEMAVEDLEAMGYLTRTNVASFANRAGAPNYVGLQTDRPTLEDVMFLAQGRASQYEETQQGAQTNSWYLAPRSTLKPRGHTKTERAVNNVAYTLNIGGMATHMPYGETFTDLVHRFTSAAIIPGSSNYPLWWHAHTGDNTEDEFILSLLPVSIEQTFVFVERVLQIPGVDYTLSNYTITFAANPAANARIVTVYGYDG